MTLCKRFHFHRDSRRLACTITLERPLGARFGVHGLRRELDPVALRRIGGRRVPPPLLLSYALRANSDCQRDLDRNAARASFPEGGKTEALKLGADHALLPGLLGPQPVPHRRTLSGVSCYTNLEQMRPRA